MTINIEKIALSVFSISFKRAPVFLSFYFSNDYLGLFLLASSVGLFGFKENYFFSEIETSPFCLEALKQSCLLKNAMGFPHLQSFGEKLRYFP